ncbi:biotin/lipoyl-containing protein [Pisciglobus halotolerans]|uniref:Biotin-requiring enzyme n=1 Tax=Pisciglobus halotolerans TaxID=745365 RepID=A0A1I3BP21_9LACT|nr:biotin/lipoyl-containing protein [Pisciglobus halotolerans]SFH64022.1 Biotin-requiring enzyme [Pisciglobus halotolerans]
MKSYEITVNEKVYQVSVEEIDANSFKAHQQTSSTVTPEEPPMQQKTAASTASSGTLVTAPMPGNIIKVSVQVGEAVKAGQVLCVLEAMKMENEIVAPEDGTISEVNISKGASVEAGDTLVKL